jgi:hypothetical protein
VSAYSEKCFAAARPNDTLRSSDQNSLFGYTHKTVHVRPWPKTFRARQGLVWYGKCYA